MKCKTESCQTTMSDGAPEYCPSCQEKMAEEPHAQVASDQLRRELHAVIRRYGQESDVTVYQAIGVLEIVKLDLVEMLEKSRE